MSAPTGRDWATAPYGDCFRCGRHTIVLILTQDDPDPVFDVELCPACHPLWPHMPRPDRPGLTFTTADLDTLRAYSEHVTRERSA